MVVINSVLEMIYNEQIAFLQSKLTLIRMVVILIKEMLMLKTLFNQ